jgi:hypothetical protein
MTQATPNVPRPERRPIPAIKIATPDIMLNRDLEVPIEAMTQLGFESLASRELIEVVRADLVKGQNVNYKPVQNLSRLSFEYSPEKLVALQSSTRSFFNSFPIDLNNYVPDIGTGPAGSIVYIDEETRSLVIDFINLASDHQIEVQILSSGELFDDTIYTEQGN